MDFWDCACQQSWRILKTHFLVKKAPPVQCHDFIVIMKCLCKYFKKRNQSTIQWNVVIDENLIDDHQFAPDFLHDSLEINSGHISYLWPFQKNIKTKLGQKICSICNDLKSLIEPQRVLLKSFRWILMSSERNMSSLGESFANVNPEMSWKNVAKLQSITKQVFCLAIFDLFLSIQNSVRWC